MEGQSGDSREDSPNDRDTRSSSYRGQRYSGGSGGGGSGGGGGAGIVPGGRGADFPLRILVPSDMVGAIIGRSGGTIRNITQETRARVDVHRKENSGSSEKVITIYGNAENCSKACQKIMEVMQKEANSTNKDEIPLKILAYNNLIGRIIGKNGNTIKRIMEQTETKITVSTNIHDVNSFNLERIITIEGRLKDICAAEQIISSKLRQSYESDLAMLASPQTMMFPGLHPMAMMSTLGSHNYPPARGTPAPGPSSFGMYGSPSSFLPPAMPYASNAPPPITSARPGASPLSSLPQEQIKETVYLYIPNVAVGAIIGTGGSTIREMISSSGAGIKVSYHLLLFSAQFTFRIILLFSLKSRLKFMNTHLYKLIYILFVFPRLLNPPKKNINNLQLHKEQPKLNHRLKAAYSQVNLQRHNRVKES